MARPVPGYTPQSTLTIEEFYVTNAAATEVWPGKAYPLGASYDGYGTNFAVFSEVAERVELCLFDEDGT